MSIAFFPQTALSQPLFAALNHVLAQADWARLRLQPFAGKVVRMAMPPFSFTCAIDAQGLLQASGAAPDLDIALPANSPFLAVQGNEAVMKAARLEGPADLANTLSFVLRHLRWDLEEDLSKLVGDIAAHRIVEVLGALFDWQRAAVRRLGENVSEYLTYENPTLVPAAEAAAFASDVERMSSKLSLMETRVQRIKEK